MEKTNTGVLKMRSRLVNLLLQYGIYFIVICVCMIYAFLSEYFLTAGNFLNIIANANAYLIMGIGMTYILLLGEIDLSVGSAAAVSGTVFTILFVKQDVPLPLACAAAVLTSLVIGLLNAVLVVKLKINSFLATTGVQILLRGVVYILTNLQKINLKSNQRYLITAGIGGIPYFVWLGVLLLIIMQVVLRKTRFGRNVVAVGCGPAAASKVGIPVRGTVMSVFAMSGFFSGIAGICAVLNLGGLSPSSIGLSAEFQVITAAVLGGTSLFGGVGALLPGALIGTWFLKMIEVGMALCGASAYAYPVVRGIIIFLSMAVDSIKRRIG